MLIADTEDLRDACCEFIQVNENVLKSTGILSELSEGANVKLFKFMHEK